jgi:formylglycine-generating enzyme required for sulfatase activity
VQQKCGIELRLPTEAEWEYACRAGTTTDYYSGNGEGALRQVGWFDGNSGGSTKPVGQLKANAWNLHDLHGNVWEWCSDRYGKYAQSSKDDPQGPTSGSSRVLRGGGWDDSAENCRAAYRFRLTPTFTDYFLGFRLARVPSGSE